MDHLHLVSSVIPRVFWTFLIYNFISSDWCNNFGRAQLGYSGLLQAENFVFQDDQTCKLLEGEVCQLLLYNFCHFHSVHPTNFLHMLTHRIDSTMYVLNKHEMNKYIHGKRYWLL